MATMNFYDSSKVMLTRAKNGGWVVEYLGEFFIAKEEKDLVCVLRQLSEEIDERRAV